MIGKEYAWSASGTKLFESGYGVALDFVVIFHCHLYAPQLRLKPLLLQFLLQGLRFSSGRIPVPLLSCGLHLRRALHSP